MKKTNPLPKEKKNFFKNENERNIWVRLNAEHIQYKTRLTEEREKEMGTSAEDKHTCLWISNNQLTYDEYERDAPRFSLEELLLLSPDELFRLDKQREEEEVLRMFNECEAERIRRNKNKK